MYARLVFTEHLRCRLWKRMHRLLSHNVSLYQAFAHVAREAEGRPSGRVIRKILTRLSSGWRLSRALEGFVSEAEFRLFQAAERGDLGGGFLRAAELLEDRRVIRSNLFRAVRYPLFLSLLVVGILILFARVLVPGFADVIPAGALQGSSRMLYEISVFLTWEHVLAGLVLLVFAIAAQCYAFSHGTGVIRQHLDKIFPWSLYRMAVGADFLLCFAHLLASNMQASEIFALYRKGSCTPYLADHIRSLQMAMARGLHLGEAFYAADRNFPTPEVVEDLRFYSKLPGFESEIVSIARDCADEVLHRMNRTLTALGLVLLLSMAGVTAFLFRAVFDLQTQMALYL